MSSSTTSRNSLDSGSLSSVAITIAVVVSILGLVCCVAVIVIVVCLIKKLNRPRSLIGHGGMAPGAYPMYSPYYPAPYGNPYAPPAPTGRFGASADVPPPYPGASAPGNEMTKVSD